MAPPTNIPPVNPFPAQPAQGSGQVVQIVTLPEGLKENARSIRLEGEVVAQNKDGSTRISTSEGDIDVTFRGKQPQVGTKLEVDIPAGNPPRNITVRPAPLVPQPLPTIPTTPQIPTTPTQQTPAPTVPTPQDGTKPAPTDKPTQPTTQQPAPTQPTPRPAPVPNLPPLTTGDVVEMVPLPEVIVAQTKPAPIPTAPLQQTPSQDNNAPKPLPNVGRQIENAIQQKPQSGIVNALLQSLKASLPNLLTPPVLGTPQNATPAPANTVTATSITILPSTAPQTQIVVPDLPMSAPIIAKIMAITSPTGQTMYATPEIVTAPSTPQVALQIPSAPPVQNVTVTVTSLTPQNQPVIPLPLNINGAAQNFVIQTPPGTLPIGTHITLMPMAQQTTTTAPSVVPQAWRSFLPFMQASSTWPIMDEIFQTFYQATPQAAQILGRVMPSPANAQNLGAAVMLFAAAARAGEIQNWMGDKKMEMIHKLGKDALVSRLSAETSSLSNNNDLPATEWKSIPIPLLWQNEISKVLFHVRQEPQEGNKQDKEGNTRFILDLSLPRMGNVQLDGIINGKRLDVIVRTEMSVSYPMQEAMKVAYAGALDGSDVYGELGFQSDVNNFVNVVTGDENFVTSI